ncbi:MAG: Homogentisate 1,2-dioxygenase, partial [uncultured Gemmatimonadaceae bacterium]
ADLPHARRGPAQAALRLPQARRRHLLRAAHGARGVLRHLVAALPRAPAHDREVGAARARPRVGRRGRPGADAPALAHLAGEGRREPHARPHPAPVQPGHRDALRGARRAGRALLPQRPGGRAGLRRQGERRARVDLRRPPLRRGRLPRDPPRHHAPVEARPGLAHQAARLREPRPRALAEALPQPVRAAPRGGAVLRARHPPPARAQPARRDGRPPHPRQAVRRAQRVHPRPPPVRRRRVGRLLLPLGVQHPGLRADRRARAPAAAGAPDVRGGQLRRLLVLPAAVRLRRGRRAGALQPQQRGLRRGDLLRLGRVHEPQGDRVRERHAPPRRHPPRPAPGARRGVDRPEVDERAGGDDGLVPAAQDRQGRAPDRGPHLPPVVDRGAARAGGRRRRAARRGGGV